MRFLRGIWRLSYFLLITIHLVIVLLLRHLLKKDTELWIMARRKRYVHHLYRTMGIRLHSEGILPTGAGIVMGNHRSYFDPSLIVYDVPGYPVAKAEVEKWPIIGLGAKLTGVVFVQRENRKSRAETLGAIKEKINEGSLVFLFPEGTTKGERLTTEFRLGGFTLAANNGYTIWPVAVEYDEPDNYWINNSSFVPHLFRQLCRKEIHMRIKYGAPLTGSDGTELMTRCRAWIDAQLEDYASQKAQRMLKK
jgi:lyso-ornithine lipid O-acyltransferase